MMMGLLCFGGGDRLPALSLCTVRASPCFYINCISDGWRSRPEIGFTFFTTPFPVLVRYSMFICLGISLML